MTRLPLRWALGFLFLSQAAAALAQTIQLPSVPVGGLLQAKVSLSAAGAPALSGIDVTLTALNNCGNFGGANPIHVVTDSTGSFSFSLRAGSTPGVCTVEGRNGNFVGRAATTIYRPAEVTLDAATVLMPATPNSFVGLTVTVRAGGLPLFGVPVTVDPLPASGSSGTVMQLSASDASGNASINVQTNGVPGIFDVIARNGTASRTLRINQSPKSTMPDLPGRNGHVSWVPAGRSVAISFTEAASSCRFVDAIYSADSSSMQSPGMKGFPQGLVDLKIDGCPARSTVKVKLEYPDALPANGVFQAAVASSFATIPHTISGNTVVFTLVDDGLGDFTSTPQSIHSLVGVAEPGQRVAPPPIPPVKDMWWVGPEENGWGMSMAQTTAGDVFAAIYAYDEAGKPTWWVVPGVFWEAAHASFLGETYSPYATPWFAYDPRLTIGGDPKGPFKLTIRDTGHVAIDYTMNGVSGHKEMQRQVFASPAQSPLTGLGGMWWGGSTQSGWGVSIIQQHATLFAVWYTYDEQNRPTWFVMPGGAWNGSTTYEGRIFKTRGSPWLGRPYDPAQLVATDVGPYRLRFSGAQASLEYTVEGRSGSLALTRQAPF